MKDLQSLLFFLPGPCQRKNGNAAIPTAYRSPTSIRFLRIQPTSWHKGSALRIEVYGCYINETAPTKDRFVDPLGCCLLSL